MKRLLNFYRAYKRHGAWLILLVAISAYPLQVVRAEDAVPGELEKKWHTWDLTAYLTRYRFFEPAGSVLDDWAYNVQFSRTVTRTKFQYGVEFGFVLGPHSRFFDDQYPLDFWGTSYSLRMGTVLGKSSFRSESASELSYGLHATAHYEDIRASSTKHQQLEPLGNKVTGVTADFQNVFLWLGFSAGKYQLARLSTLTPEAVVTRLEGWQVFVEYGLLVFSGQTLSVDMTESETGTPTPSRTRQDGSGFALRLGTRFLIGP